MAMFNNQMLCAKELRRDMEKQHLSAERQSELQPVHRAPSGLLWPFKTSILTHRIHVWYIY